MAKKMPVMNLPSADALFTTQEQRDDSKREKVLDISLSEIDDFPDHRFHKGNLRRFFRAVFVGDGLAHPAIHGTGKPVPQRKQLKEKN